jgi:hypothetical protein
VEGQKDMMVVMVVILNSPRRERGRERTCAFLYSRFDKGDWKV